MNEVLTPIKKLRRFARNVRERLDDWRYGIYTHADIDLADIGIDDSECYAHRPTDKKRFRTLLQHIEIRADQDVFVDYGAGLGRAVLLAATCPFRKVIGIELSGDLCAAAVRNVEKMRRRLQCRDIEIHHLDVRVYEVPPEASVFYFWNPFGTEILQTVLENIRRSVQAHPRKVSILYTAMPGDSRLEPLKPLLPWLQVEQELELDAYVTLTLASIRPEA